jgi:hypothetical protein
MRILTLLAGPDALADATGLTAEIREFNAGIDFRLRFLHIEIEEAFAADEASRAALDEKLDRQQVFPVPGDDPLAASAALALLLDRERPDLLVITGPGGLLKPGVAAARAAGTKLAFFGRGRGALDGAMERRGTGDPLEMARGERT